MKGGKRFGSAPVSRRRRSWLAQLIPFELDPAEIAASRLHRQLEQLFLDIDDAEAAAQIGYDVEHHPDLLIHFVQTVLREVAADDGIADRDRALPPRDFAFQKAHPFARVLDDEIEKNGVELRQVLLGDGDRPLPVAVRDAQHDDAFVLDHDGRVLAELSPRFLAIGHPVQAA